MEMLLLPILYNYPIHVNRILTLKPQRVWIIPCTQGDYILKALSFPPKESNFILGAMEHLSNQGFYSFNQLILTKDQERSVSDQGKTFFLSKKIPGVECNFQDKEQVKAGAEFLGRLHLAAQGYKPKDPYEQRVKWGTCPQMFREKQSDLQVFGDEALKEKNEFNSLYKRFIPYFSQEITKSLEKLNSSPYLDLSKEEESKGGFCHHDLAHHNFVIGDSVNIIDFDYAIGDIRAHDITNFLGKVLKANHWDTEIPLAALEAYDKVNPLKKGECQVILAMVSFPQDFWQCGLARYCEKNFSTQNETKLARLLKQRYLRGRALENLEQNF